MHTFRNVYNDGNTPYFITFPTFKYQYLNIITIILSYYIVPTFKRFTIEELINITFGENNNVKYQCGMWVYISHSIAVKKTIVVQRYTA